MLYVMGFIGLKRVTLRTEEVRNQELKKGNSEKCPDRSTGRGIYPTSAIRSYSDEFGFYY